MKKESTKSSQFMTEAEFAVIKEMQDPEMESLLVGLRGSRQWLAILRYNHARLEHADNALRTLDPYKDPTALARFQGIITGLSDLAEGVAYLGNKQAKAEAGNKEE